MAKLSTQNQVIIDSLHHIPFFRSLSPETLLMISAKLQKVHFEHGQIIFVEDSLGDAMYLIESGQVKVSVNTAAGQQEKIINYLGPGNFFGELALLLDQRRSATITATIDADLWVLHKADMDDLLVDHPEIALQITKELSSRLSDAAREIDKRPGHNLSAVFGSEPWRLAEHIYNLTQESVVLFDATGHNLRGQAGPDYQHDKLPILEAVVDLSSETLAEALSILADGYEWVLIALPPGYSEVNAKALQLASATVLYQVSAEDWIPHASRGPIFYCDGTEKEIARTARKITRRVIGLALSSGGARGIAHIGVLEALEKAKIPVDMIVGTSAGSLFGGLYAIGKSTSEIADFARNLIKKIDIKSGLWDPKFRLPWNGLIKGNATLKYLAKQFEQATFIDTKIPFYVVAADVLSGEEVIFEKGPLAEAVRASIGMIGIFSPYQLNHHYLIDGGAVNPVPASVLAEKGADIIIASSVIPSIEEERARGRAIAPQQGHPNFLGVLTSMMAIMEREIVKTRMTSVDVLIRPKVEIYTAMDYDKANEFVQLGREATQKELPLLQTRLTNKKI
jgi:NTE family protein